MKNTDAIDQLQGKSKLVRAITSEMEIGLSILPAIEYARFFRFPLPKLLQKPTPYLQRWFSIIRNARITHLDPRLVKDEFMNPGPLQSWAGVSPRTTTL